MQKNTTAKKPFLTTTLFLGLQVTDSYAQALKTLDPEVLHLFLASDDKFLHKVKYHNAEYIGKYAGDITDTRSLRLLEANIYSLLKKMFKNLPVVQTPLKLVPVES